MRTYDRTNIRSERKYDRTYVRYVRSVRTVHPIRTERTFALPYVRTNVRTFVLMGAYGCMGAYGYMYMQ